MPVFSAETDQKKRSADQQADMTLARETARLASAGLCLDALQDPVLIGNLKRIAIGKKLGPRQAGASVAAAKALKEIAIDFDPATRKGSASSEQSLQVNVTFVQALQPQSILDIASSAPQLPAAQTGEPSSVTDATSVTDAAGQPTAATEAARG